MARAREPTHASGHCAMRGSCDSRASIPCVFSGPAVEPDPDFRTLLVSVCGTQFSEGPVCCTKEQVNGLRTQMVTADAITSSCPACNNNFKTFFCQFTCSQDQATFLNVTSSRKYSETQDAVETVDFFVADALGGGFYNSCKDVQYTGSNGYVMDLIGGGAKDYSAFLEFLGERRPGYGSPFQINFPPSTPEMKPLNVTSRSCADAASDSLCACVDCPSRCLALSPPPAHGATCHVGAISCLSFVVLLAYAMGAIAFISGYVLQRTFRRKKDRTFERVALSGDAASNNVSSPASHHAGLVGASSLARYGDGDGAHDGHLGRGAALLDPIETVQPRHNKLNTVLRRLFYRVGFTCASHPWVTFVLVFALFGAANLGWGHFEIETDPVRLWVGASSESKQHKEIFDQNFGPFYRTEQIFVTSLDPPPDDWNGTAVPVLNWERLKWWAGVQDVIRTLQSVPNGYTLSDVCFKPAGPSGACVVQSATAWFGRDIHAFNESTWADQLVHCTRSPGSVSCLPDFQQPLEPQFVLGGVPEGDDRPWLDAQALVTNYVVSNSLEPSQVAKAEEWERTLRAYLGDLATSAQGAVNARVTFSTGVSLEEEISKSANTDVKIVVLSYLAMFFYVALTLGDGSAAGPQEDGFFTSLAAWARQLPRRFSRQAIELADDPDEAPPRWLPRLPRRLFVGSKFTLGLFGIVVVLLSVSAATGIFSFLGVKVTLIIAEVIPFLVLAVGVDNVFILVHEVDRQTVLHGPYVATAANPTIASTNPMSPTGRAMFEATRDSDAESAPTYLSPEERIARALAKMGPSILLSSLTETIAFALGALVPMPAVRNFALYAAGSVFLNACLQVTVFVSALAIDLRRTEAGRIDCFPCIRMPYRIALQDAQPIVNPGKLARFIRRHYAPFLLRPSVKGAVLLIFGGLFVTSVISMQHIALGLDERLALPRDSYLISYFDDVHAYLEVGPPVYFVTMEQDLSYREGQRHICGRFTTCDDHSLVNVLEAERKHPRYSYIAQPAAAWIDDFFLWLNPMVDCCSVRTDDPTIFCGSRDSEDECQPCLADREPAWNITMNGFPEGPEFMHYLRQWLDAPTNEDCIFGGKAAYSTAVSIDAATDTVHASHFRTSHSALRTQADFIDAFTAAHRIADDITQQTGAKVFPYSLFYVFFDQYVHIVSITQEVLGLGLASVLVMTAILLDSWRTGTIVTGVVALTVVNVMGVMGAWGINLNAISVVNLVISLGISVEFCAHIARAFMGAGAGGPPVDHPAGQKERDERMYVALVDVGPSVLSGITITKLIGMSVLAFTRSRLLEIYHFRMWFTLIIAGALHGLVLLPVVLSLAGGPGYALDSDTDEEWMRTAIRRHDYEYTPFLADSDSVNSD